MKELRQRKICKNIYRWAAACAACLILLIFGLTGLAARIGTVTVNNVNVRKEASAESERVCQLPSGTTVTILEETQGGDGNIWYNTSFTYEGAETTGWIRSDMLNISETEEDPEGEAPQGAGESIGGFTILEPEEERELSDALTQTEILVGEEYRTVWQVNPELTGGWELYLVYAAREDGSTNWFFYDSSEGTFQRDLGQFSGGGAGDSEGLLQALQDELTQLKEDRDKQLSQRLYLIIGLGVLSAILLILVIVFAVKYRNAEYEYYDDEDEEDDDYDDEPVVKKRRGFLRQKEEEEEIEEGSDFDEFVAAVRKKWSEDDKEDDDDFDEEEYEEDVHEEETLEDELPEIDMSAVLEIEEEAEKAREQSREEDSEEDDIDGFDIEILDFDDLDI